MMVIRSIEGNTMEAQTMGVDTIWYSIMVLVTSSIITAIAAATTTTTISIHQHPPTVMTLYINQILMIYCTTSYRTWVITLNLTIHHIITITLQQRTQILEILLIYPLNYKVVLPTFRQEDQVMLLNRSLEITFFNNSRRQRQQQRQQQPQRLLRKHHKLVLVHPTF